MNSDLVRMLARCDTCGNQGEFWMQLGVVNHCIACLGRGILHPVPSRPATDPSAPPPGLSVREMMERWAPPLTLTVSSYAPIGETVLPDGWTRRPLATHGRVDAQKPHLRLHVRHTTIGDTTRSHWCVEAPPALQRRTMWQGRSNDAIRAASRGEFTYSTITDRRA